MVRLKAGVKWSKFNRTLFQFLMVRLKVQCSHFACDFVDISIPYGSIKSEMDSIRQRNDFVFQFLMVRLKARRQAWPAVWNTISIPYGSIKRWCVSRFSWCGIISIPYGSIKRAHSLRGLELVSLFQFLMVRLKAGDDEFAGFLS